MLQLPNNEVVETFFDQLLVIIPTKWSLFIDDGYVMQKSEEQL